MEQKNNFTSAMHTIAQSPRSAHFEVKTTEWQRPEFGNCIVLYLSSFDVALMEKTCRNSPDRGDYRLHRKTCDSACMELFPRCDTAVRLHSGSAHGTGSASLARDIHTVHIRRMLLGPVLLPGD